MKRFQSISLACILSALVAGLAPHRAQAANNACLSFAIDVDPASVPWTAGLVFLGAVQVGGVWQVATCAAGRVYVARKRTTGAWIEVPNGALTDDISFCTASLNATESIYVLGENSFKPCGGSNVWGLITNGFDVAVSTMAGADRVDVGVQSGTVTVSGGDGNQVFDASDASADVTLSSYAGSDTLIASCWGYSVMNGGNQNDIIDGCAPFAESACNGGSGADSCDSCTTDTSCSSCSPGPCH